MSLLSLFDPMLRLKMTVMLNLLTGIQSSKTDQYIEMELGLL